MFASANSRRLPLIAVIVVVLVAVLAGGGWLLWPRLESVPPTIAVSPDAGVLGQAPIEITVADAGSGLKALNVTLTAGGAEQSIAAEQFGDPVRERKLTLLASKLSGLKEGPATLKITARDASLWQMFRGNEVVVQKELAIDVTPPSIELIADDRYVNFGGVGVVVYKASPDTATSGVKIGDYFFPGFAGQIKDHPDHFLVMFAHPYNVPAETRARLVATDKAGNTREMGLVYELKNVAYRKSTIPLSDIFLQGKVVPLVTDVNARQGAVKDVFVAVNKTLRKANEDRILAITSRGSPQMLWQGAFAQLSNSKVEANFADERTYTYNNETVDTAYHLGYDLSVTKRYPVEAANSGKVAFTGDLGIYGNTVILDHGLGLYTLYSHLSAIDVKEGDSIAPRQPLGKTGETGLAAGDHLHYGVYLNGVAVLPVEWWDPKWIADNIQPKLEGRTGNEIAEAQQAKQARGGRAAKAAAKSAGKSSKGVKAAKRKR